MNSNGFEIIGVSSSGTEMADVERDEGIRTIIVEMSRRITPVNDFKSLIKLYRLIKKEKPEIVHSHTPKAGLLAMMAARAAGVKIRLHTVAGLPLMEATGSTRKLLESVEKLVYLCSTKVYPNSKGLYDFIVQNKFTKTSKLKVIGNGSSNGIDTAHFNPANVSEEKKVSLKNSLEISESDFVFVFVGRMVGDKGINELVEAFINLKSKFKQAKLLLVGPFEEELDPLKPKTIQTIESTPEILFVDFQPDVRPYFAISDCLAFPSYREGFPNVVMQAGAMGLPSIVSDINGCNEIIEEGQNGLIIPAKNVAELENAMVRMISDSELFHKTKSNSRTMICERFEQKVVWEALLKEYRDLLK